MMSTALSVQHHPIRELCTSRLHTLSQSSITWFLEMLCWNSLESLAFAGARATHSPCTHVNSLQSCLTQQCYGLCSPTGSSVHGILQARTLEWVAMLSSRGSSWSRDWTCGSYVSCIGRWVLYHKPHLLSGSWDKLFSGPKSNVSGLVSLIAYWAYKCGFINIIISILVSYANNRANKE